MGNRFILERAEKAGVGFCNMWQSSHIGHFFKRKLSKARRRAWKTGREKGLTGLESTCNWKNW